MPGKKPSRTGDVASERSLELKEIQQLIDLLIEREVAEFEMERDGMRVRIMRQPSVGGVPAQASPGNSSGEPSLKSAEPAPVPPSARSQESEAPELQPEDASAENLHLLRSPIVGTFFAAPAPDAPPFVNLGDRVHVGQVLCIVEAMKLMNEIESEFAGEIVRIHAENGQPVEYGQLLYTIKPS